MKIILVSISLLFLITNCSSVPGTHKGKFEISQIRNLKIGQINREGAFKLFGAPDDKVIISHGPTKEEVWAYFEKGPAFTRLSLSFSETSGVLENATWNVWQGEPEGDLVQAKKLCANAIFRHYDAPWTNPHSQPDEEFYEDQSKGFLITSSYAHHQVRAISWSSPEDQGLELSSTPSAHQ